MQITATLTFATACASAGITVLIGNDLNLCSENHCTSFETAAAMAFIGWFAVSPSFLLNLWSLACRWKMRRNGYSLLSIWVWPRSSFSFLVVDGWFLVCCNLYIMMMLVWDVQGFQIKDISLSSSPTHKRRFLPIDNNLWVMKSSLSKTKRGSKKDMKMMIS